MVDIVLNNSFDNPLQFLVERFVQDRTFIYRWTSAFDIFFEHRREKIANAIRLFISTGEKYSLVQLIASVLEQSDEFKVVRPTLLTDTRIFTKGLREALLKINTSNIGGCIQEMAFFIDSKNYQKKNRPPVRVNNVALVITWLSAYIILGHPNHFICYKAALFTVSEFYSNGWLYDAEKARREDGILKVENKTDYSLVVQASNSIENAYPQIKKLPYGIYIFYFWISEKRNTSPMYDALLKSSPSPLIPRYYLGDSIQEMINNSNHLNQIGISEHTLAAAVSIAGRQGQQDFRKSLLRAYGKCAITGSKVEPILEAAHIHPYREDGSFEISNGLLLRADIHTLFDLGLIAIDTNNMRVVISSLLNGTEYQYLNGLVLTLPEDLTLRPDKSALDTHRFHSKI